MKKVALLLLAVFGIAALAYGSDMTYVTIGTAGVPGIYYHTGGAISMVVNEKNNALDIKATVEPTPGSVYNINAVLNGDLEFALAQSDRMHQAYNGLADWAGMGARKELRSVFAVYPETITLVASDKSGIKDIKDLPGNRVELGAPGSGQHQNALDVLAHFGVNPNQITDTLGRVDPAALPLLMQNDKLDAFFYTAGHPNDMILDAVAGKMKVNIIPITGKPVLEMIRNYPYYASSIIAGQLYPEATNGGDIESVGVQATLVTSSRMSEEVVYALTKKVFDNLDAFKKLHPAYGTLTAKSMLQSLTAPIHKGALRYYQEAGLLQYIDPRLIQ